MLLKQENCTKIKKKYEVMCGSIGNLFYEKENVNPDKAVEGVGGV